MIQYTLDQLPRAAQWLLDNIGDHTVLAFHAEMGVGKTTLIAEIARTLGVTDDVANSPSFAIINEYDVVDLNNLTTQKLNNSKIYHFDCYRLQSEEEGLEIGVEDYLYSGCLCLIEWPGNIQGLLPEDTLHIYIKEDPDTHIRTLYIGDENN